MPRIASIDDETEIATTRRYENMTWRVEKWQLHVQMLLYSASICNSKTIPYETEDAKTFYGREAK